MENKPAVDLCWCGSAISQANLKKKKRFLYDIKKNFFDTSDVKSLTLFYSKRRHLSNRLHNNYIWIYLMHQAMNPPQKGDKLMFVRLERFKHHSRKR